MPVKFYKKSYLDLHYPNASITVDDSTATNDGAMFVNQMRNRDNNSGWATTGSNDAAQTTLFVDLGDFREVNSIMLIEHNFKSYRLQYYNELAETWSNVSPIIDTTLDSLSTSFYEFETIEARDFRLLIRSTKETNADKFMRQFLICEKIGELGFSPQLAPTIDRDRKTTKFISGRNFVSTQVGGFACKLSKKSVSDVDDIELVERLFQSYDGFLVSLSGGLTTGFEVIPQGFRPQDIFFCQCANEYKPSFKDGFYKHGVDISMDLVEVN